MHIYELPKLDYMSNAGFMRETVTLHRMLTFCNIIKFWLSYWLATGSLTRLVLLKTPAGSHLAVGTFHCMVVTSTLHTVPP